VEGRRDELGRRGGGGQSVRRGGEERGAKRRFWWAEDRRHGWAVPVPARGFGLGRPARRVAAEVAAAW